MLPRTALAYKKARDCGGLLGRVAAVQLVFRKNFSVHT